MNSITTPIGASTAGPADRTAAHHAGSQAWRRCALLLALWFSATAGLRPLAIPDEGRYVGVAWEMLRSGHWLVPTLNGQPFFHKPPLFYWITAGAMDLLGTGVWSARIASLLAATAAATALFTFLRRLATPRLARDAVLVLATLPLYYGGAQYANLDMLVAACITIAILSGADAVLSSQRGASHRVALASSFAAAACGVLAKGLIGAVLPGLVLLGWTLSTGRVRPLLRLIGWLPGWIVFFGISAPWFIAMQWRFPGFAHYFFVVQHLQRFTAAGFNSPQPLWFYPALLVAATLPWSPYAYVAATARCWRRTEHRDLRILMIVWIAVVTAFFSLPQSKLIGYILPALPPLAFLLADAAGWVDGQPRSGRRRIPWRRLYRSTPALAAIVCVAIASAEHFYQPKSLTAMASHLRAERHAGEPVVFMGRFPYDLPFYARLEAPVYVVDEWLTSEVRKDSWRRELVDADAFAAPSAAHFLVDASRLAPWLCDAPRGVTWVVGASQEATGMPWLASQAPAFRSGDSALWRVVTSDSAGVCGLGGASRR